MKIWARSTLKNDSISITTKNKELHLTQSVSQEVVLYYTEFGAKDVNLKGKFYHRFQHSTCFMYC